MTTTGTVSHTGVGGFTLVGDLGPQSYHAIQTKWDGLTAHGAQNYLKSGFTAWKYISHRRLPLLDELDIVASKIFQTTTRIKPLRYDKVWIGDDPGRSTPNNKNK